jgi:transposase
VCGRSLLLMDNASIHKGQSVIDAARSVGCELWFLPPYSPQFQPVENAFSVLKSAYRRTDVAHPVVDRIQECLVRFTPAGLHNTFESCWRFATAGA